jgi:hypothetical protein
MAAGAQDVQNAVEGTPVVGSGSSGWLGRRQQWPDKFPLGIAEIRPHLPLPTSEINLSLSHFPF